MTMTVSSGLTLANLAQRGNRKSLGDLLRALVGTSLGTIGTFTASIFAGNIQLPVATVAAAGSTLADAAQLAAGVSIVSGADGTKGVKLPATPAAGTVVFVKGTTASQVLKVYPDAAATINAIASNGAISLASGATPAIFVAASATQWYTFPLLPS